MSEPIGEKSVAITGIGQSEVTRGTDRWAIDLTVDACLEAIADAGLTRADIDGVACWPGGGTESSGFAPVGAAQLQDALRLDVGWYNGTGETSGSSAPCSTPSGPSWPGWPATSSSSAPSTRARPAG